MQSQKLYSLIARFYDLGLLLNGYKGAAARVVKELPFPADAPLRVLDAGCGTGLYSLAILSRFSNSRIAAFDFNPKMIARIKQNLTNRGLANRAEVFEADILQELSRVSDNFDLIVTGGFLEYVDAGRAIANLARHLNKNSYFLNAPVKNSLCGRWVGRWMDFVPYSYHANVAAFTENNFRLQKQIKIPFYFPISLVKEAHLFRKL